MNHLNIRQFCQNIFIDRLSQNFVYALVSDHRITQSNIECKLK